MPLSLLPTNSSSHYSFKEQLNKLHTHKDLIENFDFDTFKKELNDKFIKSTQNVLLRKEQSF